MRFNSYMIIQIIFFLSFLDEIPDPYQRVYDLEHHVDDLEPDDLFQYIVTAVLLGSYLEQRTKFFATTCDTASSNLENLSLTPNKVDRLPNICKVYIFCEGHKNVKKSPTYDLTH